MTKSTSTGSTRRCPSSSKGRADPTGGPGSFHEFLDHTSEIQLRVRAPSWAALLAEAGRALGELLLRGALARADGRSRAIVVSSGDREALLVDWLNEILYVAETERWVPTEFDIEQASETSVKAVSHGVPVPEAPAVVKATTHHDLSVREVEGAMMAEVIFDV